ncbi:MAG TPA: MarR family transcriptional regulator [Candidatus Saccharimonadales bacterium]|jgi:DNA-binding MarR family transcriptional regulator|nr:MarR family transcriptional regulator [Candidatus Saccharimonadales bacterium]
MRQKADTLLPALLKRCARLIDRSIDESLKQHAIARSQYRVMYYVARHSEPTQTSLREAMQIQASTLTLIVNRLVQKGWLVRVKDGSDKRTNKLQLTADGEKRLQQIPDPLQKLQQTILQNLTKAEAEALTLSLNKVINKLSAKE